MLLQASPRHEEAYNEIRELHSGEQELIEQFNNRSMDIFENTPWYTQIEELNNRIRQVYEQVQEAYHRALNAVATVPSDEQVNDANGREEELELLERTLARYIEMAEQYSH